SSRFRRAFNSHLTQWRTRAKNPAVACAPGRAVSSSGSLQRKVCILPARRLASSFSLNLLGAAADINYVTSRTPRTPPTEAVRVSEVLAALSFALDLTEGEPMGHSLRTCLIGMELADRLSLSLQDRRDLYYAMMLKDVGCSSSSARVHELFGGDDRLAQHWLKLVDWGNTLKAARFGLKHFVRGDSLGERARRVAMLARAGASVATELVEMRSTRGASIVRRLGR